MCCWWIVVISTQRSWHWSLTIFKDLSRLTSKTCTILYCTIRLFVLLYLFIIIRFKYNTTALKLSLSYFCIFVYMYIWIYISIFTLCTFDPGGRYLIPLYTWVYFIGLTIKLNLTWFDLLYVLFNGLLCIEKAVTDRATQTERPLIMYYLLRCALICFWTTPHLYHYSCQTV